MPIRKLVAVPLTLSVVGLSACSLLSEPTTTANEVARAAADAIEEQTGSRPEVDCGDDDSIAIVEGDEVDCVLTDPDAGTEYDVTVTFSGVDGDTWNADVQVADEPNGGGSETPSEAAEEAPSEEPADEGGLKISAERLAEATADALEDETGSRPEIDCGETELDIVIYVGRSYYCDLIDPASGLEHEVAIDVTGIEGDQFEFAITVNETPR